MNSSSSRTRGRMEEGGRNSPAVWSWADVPDEILISVSAFLPCRTDRVHMACVNGHWHAAMTGLRPPPLPPQLPWLVFLNESPTFYSALASGYHPLCRLPPDVRGARYCGSGDGGWLVLALNSPHAALALYNLNSGQRIPLPTVFRSPSDNAEFPLDVLAATLSASPSHVPYMLAAITHVDDRPTAAFWREGRETWCSTGGKLTVMPQDVIYYAGAFFFLTPREELIVFGVAHDPNGDMTLARVDYDMRLRNDYDMRPDGYDDFDMKRYLVESRGDLLMVVRNVYNEGGAWVLRVFRLSAPATVTSTSGRRPRRAWEEIFQLDGRMLFLGPGCSRSFEVAHCDGFQDQSSMIYYLDESVNSVGRWVMSNNLTAMGRYSLVEMTYKQWPPEPRPAWSDDAPPFWWLH